MNMCPFCPHPLRDHANRQPCHVEPLTDVRDASAGRVWMTFTSTCRHRDRKEQPYPWPVAVPEASVRAIEEKG